MYMIGDEVVHDGQTYVSLINYNECALDNYLAWRIKEEERSARIDEPSYRMARQVDVSDEFIEKIADAVVKKLHQTDVEVEYVVQCKDCTMWNKWERSKSLGNYGTCMFWTLELKSPIRTEPTDFCSHAKRKKEGEEL